MAETLTVTRAGLSTVQDLGRISGADYGLSAGGALDQHSARVANVLAGNLQDVPLLELTATGLTCVASVDTLVALTGAPADLHVDGLPRPAWEPTPVTAGQEIRVGSLRVGLRAYLAVHGGLAAPRLLGSVAPDPVLGFGARLRDGAVLGLARAVPCVAHPQFHHPLYRVAAPRPRIASSMVVDVTDGPDIDQFGDTADRLFDAPYVVAPESDHIGLRMAGPLPRRTAAGELLSRGMPVGAVEVPAGDQLVVLHRGRGVTAGYPVLAVVTATGLDVLGQVRPGHTIRFRRTSVAAAVAARRRQQEAVDALAARVRAALDASGLLTAA
jgi:5-oxoprolinase (ATP-hydrolysing) subunit C